ncbi:AAA family ATPase, partial [Nostoc sp. CHAB 5715]|uniref:nSTAND1 domain-containing NTPase n=1 Tax=Nostoc sp. CHAB 5715 TaxID=2780400 RepID=UPI001E49338F
AGHGIALEALENQEGPVGYLIPQDATLGDSSTYLPMQELHDALNALSCRHMLAILDCCFAGAFRWASLKREILPKITVYKERYDRFISDAAWQVITSAADDQKALDSLGQRGKVHDGNEVHSPFAKALFDALRGDTEESADLNKDGIITATELYSYLRDQVEILTENHYKRQTPGLCPLRKHDKGEFIFLLPKFDRDKLEDAPPLIPENNPYQGLESYDEKDSNLFFGRENLIKQLYQHVVSKQQALTVVLGASGTGKSSLMKAGLLPRLRHSQEHQFQILQLMRPGETPLQALAQVCSSIATAITAEELAKDEYALATIVANRCKAYPKTQLLLPIDQFEELITLCKSDEEREQFLRLIKNAIAKSSKHIDVIVTLRLDFEAQFQNSVLKDFWNDARFVVPPMTQDELREAIEKPASEKVVYFEPPSLVDDLINEVVQMPGALPLLSFTLSELYLKYLDDRTRDNRALTKKDYEELGRVVGSLTKRANQEYDQLVVKDPAYKNTVRRVMLRMISLQGGELARRQVPKFELIYPDQEESDRVQIVIKRFSEARLIVEGSNSQGQSYVEPAHDALVQGWDKLLTWKKEEEENLILQRRLTPAAEEWNNIKEQEKQSNSLVKTWGKAESLAIGKIQTWRRNWQRRKQEEINISRGSSVKSIAYLWDDDPRLDQLNQVLDADDSWLNWIEDHFVRRSILQKGKNAFRLWLTVTGVILGLSGLTLWALIGQRQALIEKISADQNSTETAFRANQLTSETLISSLRAGKSLKSLFLRRPFQPDQEWQNQVLVTLQKAVYQVKELNRWRLPQGQVRDIFLGQDDKVWIAVSTVVKTNDGHQDDIISLWDSKSQQVTKLALGKNIGFRKSVSFSPDGSQLVIVGPNETIHLCGLESKHCKELLNVQGGSIESISFSRDSKSLALIISRQRGADSWERQRSAYLWNLQSREGLKKLPGYSETQGITVEDMMFSSDGYHLVEFFKDRNNSSSKIPDISLPKIHFWDYLSDRKLDVTAKNSKVLQANLSPQGVKDVILSLDSEKMVTTPKIISPGISKLCYINFWNLSYSLANSTQEPKTFKEACSANFNPHTNQLAIGGINGDISFYDSYGNQKLLEWKAHEGAVQNVRFSSDGKRLITIGEDGIIHLWNTQEWQSSLPSLPINKKIESISVSPDGQQIALTDSQGVASLWDVSHQTLTPLPTTEGSFTSVIFAPDGKHFAGAKKDNTITVFDISGKLIYPNKFKLRRGNLKNMIFHPNGQLFIIIEHEKHLAYSIVDFSNNSQISEKSIEWLNMGYTFSRNGKFLRATLDIPDTRGGPSGIVYLEDLSSRNSIIKFNNLNVKGYSDKVAFDINGNLMAVTQQEIGKPDGTVMLWDIYANQIVNNFKTYSKAYENKTFKDAESPTGAIKSLSLSADGSTLAILDQDGTVKLWHTGLDKLLMQGCQQARNYLATLDEKNSDRHLCDNVLSTPANPNK